ncbi:hypothetical protein [Pseudoclavibacter sp. 13-3]|uniref:hypothetical protein n=1 Tax=Pseudoclavibacter sp. 13-3 TaxID=2901228 RepID=UPI001E49D1A4|nr:hypothetical protein [Pseudoclavibacter sp. 13-3]MCD7102142.1 hypothetical protein [Pseudoclavibacter sp. 13-3]
MSTLPPPPPGANQPGSTPPGPPAPPAGFGAQPQQQFGGQAAQQQFGGQQFPQQPGYGQQMPQQRQGGSVMGDLFNLNFGNSAAGRKARGGYLIVLISVLAAAANTIVLGIIYSIQLFKASSSMAASFTGANTTGGMLFGVYLLLASIIGSLLTAAGLLVVARTIFSNYVRLHERG